jgi:hypothetical protein
MPTRSPGRDDLTSIFAGSASSGCTGPGTRATARSGKIQKIYPERTVLLLLPAYAFSRILNAGTCPAAGGAGLLGAFGIGGAHCIFLTSAGRADSR